MRIVEISPNYCDLEFEDGEKELDQEELDEAIESAERERETFAEKNGLTISGYNDKPLDMLPVIDDELAAFGLEVVWFDDGGDDLMWRIGERAAQLVEKIDK
jgi:hypothetical protein